MAQQIHALLIEDDPDDILLLKDSLADVGLGRIRLDTADRLSRGLIQLGVQNYDVLLLDLNLPDSRGLDTLTTTVKRFPRLPVVVLSGLADDAITIEAVRRGAQDYLVKGEISGPLVLRVVRYAIERKQVEAVLRASEARYRTLVETSPNGITLADLEGRLLLCNQQAARMHGFANPEAMQGGDFFKLVALPERRFAALNTQKALNENRVIHAEVTLLRRDGSQFPADISTAVLRNSAGAATGFICITRDVTERKKANDAEKQLVMLEKEFISSVSSDLRTPLLSLMNNLDLLEKGEVKDELIQSEFLKHASSDASNLLDTVEELLDFSLVQGERLILNL
jgi:PAS domain S-box-containing protein